MIFECFEGAGSDNFDIHVNSLVVSLNITLGVEENVCREERTDIIIESDISICISSYNEKNIDGGFVLLEGDLSCRLHLRLRTL